MHVFIEKTNENRTIKFSGTVEGLLKILDINPETVIVSKNNELLIESDVVEENDSVKILSVISGG